MQQRTAEDSAHSYDDLSAFLYQTPPYVALVVNTVRFLFRVSYELGIIFFSTGF